MRPYRARLLCAVALSLPGLAIAASPATGAAFPGENGRIAFVSERHGGDPDIWTMNPDGSNPVNLTANSNGLDAAPSWSPDGHKIVFWSNRRNRGANPEGDTEIFVMNADGSNQTQLTFNRRDDSDPTWSADGRKILFLREFSPGDSDLFTMNRDGTQHRNLTNSPGVLDFEPNWSPDGRRISFASDRDDDLEVYTIRPDGSQLRQLTFNNASDGGANWSPDGQQLAFETDRDGNAEIYTMRADGSDPTRLTFNDAFEFLAAWSPDGRKIAFSTDRDGQLEVYTMRPNGSGQTNLTRHPAADLGPEWQPLLVLGGEQLPGGRWPVSTVPLR
jgi:Tol biopolymer transport system component